MEECVDKGMGMVTPYVCPLCKFEAKTIDNSSFNCGFTRWLLIEGLNATGNLIDTKPGNLASFKLMVGEIDKLTIESR